MASTKGVFKYDEYVEYVKQALGASKKQSNGYYIWNGGDIMIDEFVYMFGKVKDGATYVGQWKSNMDMTKKYLVELRPRYFENFSIDGEVIRNDIYYSWICKVVPAGDDYQYSIINEDCELTDEEVNSFYPDSESISAEDPRNPDILIVLTQLSDEGVGATPIMMATKRACEYFSLCVTEI